MVSCAVFDVKTTGGNIVYLVIEDDIWRNDNEEWYVDNEISCADDKKLKEDNEIS